VPPAPFRLDLTVSILRRYGTNAVDLFDEGRYLRALGPRAGDPVVEVSQPDAATLLVRAYGDADPAAIESIVRRVLNLDADVTPFLRRAAKLPWLRATAQRMRGARPPRYPSLWEACVNAVVFQQVSIISASAMLKRLIQALSPPRTLGETTLYPFFGTAALLEASDAALRTNGLSGAKAATLRRIAQALQGGELSESMLEGLPTHAASEALERIKGVGPWTAAIVMLRGFGRLDLFPAGDSGAAQSLRTITGRDDVDLAAALTALGDQRGMLYYTLLVGRLAARGELGVAQAREPVARTVGSRKK